MSQQKDRVENWTERVYRDVQNDWFVVVENQADDKKVVLLDAFSGHQVEEFTYDDFDRLLSSNDFEPVARDVVGDPERLIEKLLLEAENAVSGGGTKFYRHNANNVEFVSRYFRKNQFQDEMFFDHFLS